jgi:sarcosine oxidase subunit beta
VEGLDGFIMAAGHEGDGVALAPITGELIARSIMSGEADSALREFRLERFHHASASIEK